MARAPLELEELSRIGFGSYRIDSRVPEHALALRKALEAGCNLIDTASNYVDGRSEELVGTVLESAAVGAFVVTKVGYVSPSAATELERAGVAMEELPRLASGTPFSLDPAVLRVVLDLSRARLRRRRLDAVLLHNPERLLETGANAEELGATIARAFAFLADEVTAGRVGFYGVSSNELASAGAGAVLDLEGLAAVASAAGGLGLALIEFPLNVFERGAATDGARRSLLARAKGSVRTLVNRPLNAVVHGDNVRLAGPLAEPNQEDDPWETCVEIVAARLRARGEPELWTSFRPMQFLRDNRAEIPDPDLVDAIWMNQIDPFIGTLFDDDPPARVRETFAQLRAFARGRAQAALAARTSVAVDALRSRGDLDVAPGESNAVAACRYCLDAGADHVLVGMRRRKYVAELTPLFTYPRLPAASVTETVTVTRSV